MTRSERARQRRRVLLAAAAALLLACGGDQTPPAAPPVPSAPEAAQEAAPPQTAPPRTAAPEAAGRPAGDAAKGQVLYARYCTSCHGPRGDGDGPVAAGLDPKPARHSDATYMNALSDEQLFRVIRDGGAAVGKSPLMAPWGGSVSDAEIWDLVAFVRSLAHP